MVKEARTAATREALGPTLAKLVDEGADIVAVDADLGVSTSAAKFGQRFPERFITVGVTEQNMVGVAAGLAASGKTAFASSFAVFLPGHCYDQVRMAVAQPNLNVKLVASHGGVVTGEDGASAQALEDFALMLALPNFRVIVPADVVEAEGAIRAAASEDGPFYIRTIRPKVPVLYEDGHEFRLGEWDVLRQGNDVTLIAVGVLVKAAVDAAELLADEGIEARVLNASTLKPADEAAALSAARETGAIVTAEDHQVQGGLGSVVAGITARGRPVPIEFVGMHDRYGTTGKWDELLEHFNLTPEAIARAAKDAIARKNG